jgi:hypothetical protein
MLDQIRNFLRQHKTDDPREVAISLVWNDYIPTPKVFQSVTSTQLVDVFFAEKEQANLTLQEYIQAVTDDYESNTTPYENKGLTEATLQSYFGEIQRIAEEHQRIATEQLYYQLTDWMEATIERHLPQIEEGGPKALLPIINGRIDDIRALVDQIRSRIATEKKENPGTVLTASSGFDTQDLLKKVPVGELAKNLQTSLGLDTEEADLISKYLRRILEDVLRCPSRYRIRGLFVPEGVETQEFDPQDFVRDVYVKILPEGRGELTYGVEVTSDTRGEDFKRSAALGREAAIALMAKWYPEIAEALHYDIELNIERMGADDNISYGGGSIGLATALGIIAQCTDQVIGVEKVGDVAVTGEIADESGRIDRVTGVRWKTKAILDWNKQGIKPVPIKYVFVPSGENEAEAQAANDEYGGELEIRAFDDLEALLTAGLLFDPFRQYLETISQAEPPVAIDGEMWARIHHGEPKRYVILSKFNADKRAIASALVRRFAQERLRSKAVPAEMAHETLIPVILDASVFSRDDRLSESISRTVSRELQSFHSEPFDESLIRRELRTGRMALIFHGLDTTNELSFFDPGAAIDEYRKFYPDARLVFVCTESSWHRYRDRIVDSDACGVVPLYEGRSTFLDKHIQDVTEATNGIAKRGILVCYGREDLTPKEFFYPERESQPRAIGEKPHYIELQVQRLDADGNRIGNPRRLSEVITEGKERHLLLLADGGAGKTTLLLKLFFDCLEGQCQPSSPESQRDDAWKPLIVPLFANVGGLVNADYKALYQLFPEPHSELESTENILIMLDGLNEITPSVRRQARALANCFHQFLKTLDDSNPNHWVILSCRKQEEIRGYGSLIGQIERDETKEYFVRYEVLQLPAEDGLNYLHRAVPQTAEQLINALGDRQTEILGNPMLLYLFSTLNPDKIKEMEREQQRPLNRSLIYKMAMDEWISKQFDGKAFEPFRQAEAYHEAPRELLKLLSKEMVDRGLTSISEAEAVKIFEGIVDEQPPRWWPIEVIEYPNRTVKRPIGAKDLLNELVAGGLLKVSG